MLTAAECNHLHPAEPWFDKLTMVVMMATMRRRENVLAGDKLKTCSMWHAGTGARSIHFGITWNPLLPADFPIMLDLFISLPCPHSLVHI